MIRTFGGTVLERLGYKVLLASDGQEAVDMFRDQWRTIDLVILDRIMPRLSGTEAFREIRRIKAQIPVIFVSGFWVGDPDQADPAEREANALVAKPYTAESLARVVEKTLKKQEEHD